MSERLTIQRKQLREIVSYNKRTGIFRDRSTGEVIGTKRDERGYIRINLGALRFHAHRLAFIYVIGSCPDYVDHINENKEDNRWNNLRSATKSQNGMNRGMNANNSTGIKNVIRHQGKYQVQIKVNGKNHYMGRFRTKKAAALAADVARAVLHGQYARAK